jgi:hypothetical protein
MTDLLKLTPAEFCAATKACAEAREFALRHATMGEVWDNCPRPDWLLWVCRKVDRVPDDRTLRLYAVWCARHTPLRDGRVTGDLLTDPRLRAALDVAERFAEGLATEDDRLHHLFAARSMLLVAQPCAYFAATAAVEAALGHWPYHAAFDAAFHAYRAPGSIEANDAASRAQADQFRRVVPNPFRKEANS